ncbi:amidase [Streptomyces lacrimifluminis]|uniref:Amidase AmiA2 n=1 Tax=Streptomyces lacrimifluminis TaxID=1500077 RepID=A0A917UL40_9ACTN|nr:amidase [Streptomyces lacrimifluminis]GGJ65762.1 putative amidase AmiA2 [Streptomyces lacrimifluminis]
MTDLLISEVAAAVLAREVTAVDVVTAALARIAAVEPELCAFTEVWHEAAVRRAREVDARVAAGERLPLAGVPIAVKGRYGERAADAIRLTAAGCVPLGTTSVPAPGAGTPWQTWGLGAGGRTVNPWRADRVPGGSSAGAAAAVAAGLVPLATGADGAGSIRIPAAWCGVFGLKSTNGRLPHPDRTGLSVPGAVARRAADLRTYWRCVTGADGHAVDAAGGRGDMTGVGDHGVSVSDQEYARRPLTAVWSDSLGFARTDPGPALVAHGAALRLDGAGVVRLLPPEDAPVRLDDPGPAWLALRAPGAGPDTGTGTSTARDGDSRGDTAPAHRLRVVNDRRLAELFSRADLLLTPTTPNPPHGHEGPGDRYSTALTWAFNLSGHPAASIPAGFGPDGCPVGLQVVARHGEEEALLRVMTAAEERAGLRAPRAR